jgi:hypothetical protein
MLTNYRRKENNESMTFANVLIITFLQLYLSVGMEQNSGVTNNLLRVYIREGDCKRCLMNL